MRVNLKVSFAIFALTALLFSAAPVSADLVGKKVTGVTAYTPSGNIAATTVTTAIAELDAEKAALVGATFTGNVTPSGRMILPVGNVSYFNTTGTAITLGSQSDGSTNLVAAAVATTGLFDTCFDNGGSNTGILRYTCATTKYAYVNASFSGTPATASEEFVSGIAKNGSAVSGCKVLSVFAATQSLGFHCLVQLAQNDTLTLLVGNATAAHNITVKSLNIQAVLM